MGCHQGKRARVQQRGFTLIEMMMAVAVIGILALIVVPMFTRESRKVKADTEVAAMFGEMSVRQEQYKIENGSYLAVAECPTTTTPAGVAATTCTGAADWLLLRINPAEAVIRCKYQTFTGTGTGTNNPSGFTWSSPAANWYYILATCDGDGQTAKNATFFTSSSDTRIQKLDAGN